MHACKPAGAWVANRLCVIVDSPSVHGLRRKHAHHVVSMRHFVHVQVTSCACKSHRTWKSLHMHASHFAHMQVTLRACKSHRMCIGDLSCHTLAPLRKTTYTHYQKMDPNTCNTELELHLKVMEVNTRVAKQRADGYHTIIDSFTPVSLFFCCFCSNCFCSR